MGYCYFGRCECSFLMENGFCVYDTIDKCIHPAAVEDYKNAYKYIEYEPPKPNPDLVVVTRCKDCRYGHRFFDVINGATDSWVECRNPDGLNRDTSEDSFCSQGERKDSDGK